MSPGLFGSLAVAIGTDFWGLDRPCGNHVLPNVKGPSTPIVEFQVPKTTPSMDFGT